MKIKIILVALVAIVLNACNQTKSSKQVISVKQEQKSIVKSNAKITFDVEGMVCKMGCGGAIRKNLLHAGGVERVEVDFVEEAKSQAITVHYDSTLTDIVQLQKRIEQTNDGQFTVLSTDKTRKSN
jgi:periplasmic mercuric ion binding protein